MYGVFAYDKETGWDLLGVFDDAEEAARLLAASIRDGAEKADIATTEEGVCLSFALQKRGTGEETAYIRMFAYADEFDAVLRMAEIVRWAVKDRCGQGA